MILRDYQAQAADACERDFQTAGSTLVVLPTGCGKTLVAAEVIRRSQRSEIRDQTGCIFLAHRAELLEQAQRAIESHCGVECEYELADQRASEIFPSDVLLASVQTMISGRNGTRRMHKFSPYNYSLIVVDEVHHSTAASYRMVLDYFRSGNPDIRILGITATPNRSDEHALGQIFESVAYDYSILAAVKDGWLVPVAQQLIDIQSLDFSKCRTTAGDLNQGDLAHVMEAERNLYGICDATMKELGTHKAIMFCVSVKQAEMAADILNRYRSGVACWASGKTRTEDRQRVIRAFTEGKHQVFVNVNLVSEGFDMPDADLLIGAAPTKSPLRYTQQLGRIMRPLAGIVDGRLDMEDRRLAIAQSAKPIATVIDFCGNAGRHKLVHAVDILGGKVTASVRELVERELRKTGKPAKVEDVVLEAERREAEEARVRESARKAGLTARARYTSRYVDPFDAFDLCVPPQRAWNRGKSLSVKQKALLAKQGIDSERLAYNEGQAVLNEMFRRWGKGLCSLKQAALLKKFGYEGTHEMTRERAGEIITHLKNNGWQRAASKPV